MSWGKPVHAVALCRLHSCQPETSSSLRYAQGRRIQWYWLLAAPEVSRSGSEHTLGLELSMSALAPPVNSGIVCPSRDPAAAAPRFGIHCWIFHRSPVPAEGSPCCVWQGAKISWIQNKKCCDTQEWTPEPGTSCMYCLDRGEMRKPQISLPLFPFFRNSLPCSLDPSTPTWWHHPVSKCIISSMTSVNEHFPFQGSSSHVILRESPARAVKINPIAAAPTLTWILQPILEHPPGFQTPVSGNSLFQSGHTTAPHGPRHSNKSVFTSSSIYSLTAASSKMFADTS